MQRRELTGILLASAAIPAVLPGSAEAQACQPPCYLQTAEEAYEDKKVSPPILPVVPSNTTYSPRPHLDIARYGGHPNETSVNNSAAIARAIEVIRRKSGGVIQFPDNGTYLIENEITLPYRGIVEGAGWQTKLKMATSQNMFRVPSAGGRNEIRDIELVGNNKTGSGVIIGDSSGSPGVNLFRRVLAHDFNRAFLLGGTSRTRFEQCEAFENSYGWDFYAQSATNQNNAITLTDCCALENDYNGIGASYVPVILKGINIRGGSYEGNCIKALNAKAQINFFNAYAVVIDGVYFEYSPNGNKPTAVEAAGLNASSISNCYFNGALYGIRDTQGGAATDLSIHNNRFEAIVIDSINIPSGRRVLAWSNSGTAPIQITGPGSRNMHFDVLG